MASDDHKKEARKQLASRIAEMRAFLKAVDYDATDDDPLYPGTNPRPDVLDGYEDAHEAVSNYGLSWDKYLTNHRDETVTYVHVLSTGGPHDEFQVTFDPDDGTVESVTFVYLPWFDRVEIPLWQNRQYAYLVPGGTRDDVDAVTTFYETFYGAYVEAEYEALANRREYD